MMADWYQSYWVRGGLLAGLLITAWSGPVWLAISIGLLYIVLYRGIEVLFIAFAVDAFYGYGAGNAYVYTIGATTALVLGRFIETRIQVYNRI